MDEDFERACAALEMRMCGATFPQIAHTLKYPTWQEAKEAVASVTWTCALGDDDNA